MLNHLIKIRYQQGCRDRDAGCLPKMEDSVYLEGYLKGRPEGLDGIVQFFPSLEAYMKWKFKDSGTAKT
ncbi:hypothetical protein G7B40_000150 [Aetokthonos hydrillicola Thurmond2011]|jgi:hypothetical protein|uniref:Uncharacterized protein n=1 Tax=Aetokthonos hydrillicola Thurmond2011 TaxID=2712845 RepID=A0AAP5I1H7_9CYAN|nr:hypothetical protein [Aetokthonos hydrillicola]MBO3460140.1 hypothetical protein [Aetokthonos hydrillicola CCALA 1050]MBW4590466.1 hypothetical protein [Aetokthonos hydrillicola CCALA 1050]MDR9892996.1 hypothetical protein [Aetokthonos hydrillicola Thurmond2011]